MMARSLVKPRTRWATSQPTQIVGTPKMWIVVAVLVGLAVAYLAFAGRGAEPMLIGPVQPLARLIQGG